MFVQRRRATLLVRKGRTKTSGSALFINHVVHYQHKYKITSEYSTLKKTTNNTSGKTSLEKYEL